MAAAPDNDRVESDHPRTRALLRLAERIGHEFGDLDLLRRALVHASTGNDGRASYERLEFLGDAILGFTVADHLFRLHPGSSEGELTTRRAELVSRAPLAEVAKSLDLAALLEVGRGLRDDELDSERIQADLVEAVLGAIYVDSGIRAARKFVRRHVLGHRPAPTSLSARAPDPKSRLLHLCQANSLGQPRYRVIEDIGPDHARTFRVGVEIAGELVSEGEGRRKQAAEMAAAEHAIEHLRSAGHRDPESTGPDPDGG